MHVVSEANLCEHWSKSYKRHKEQKWCVKAFIKNISIYKDVAITIKLIRVSPRKLDKKDNLPMAFKYVADAIADSIYPGLAPGRADDTELIQWEYDQEKGKKGIRVEIYKKEAID